MRDDLHRTVPLARPWGRVLRCLSAERWTPEELAPLIVATVQRDSAGVRASSAPVIPTALEAACGDLFDDGAEKLRLTLQRMQDGPLSVVDRATCEIGLGILATHGMTEDFAGRVKQASGLLHARDEVEHMLNRVAAVHGHDEAVQARRLLNKAIALCDFTIAMGEPQARGKKSVGQLLDTDLPLGE
jgi:hypothetical protein